MESPALDDWVGRSETMSDQAHPGPVRALAATLDRAEAPSRAGEVLPLPWHWLYFLPLHRHSELDADGHARRGGFLPPVPLPRRMWAGSRFELRAPIRVGDALRRVSTIEAVNDKHGRSGRLVFVKVRHELFAGNAREAALLEWHDIVYRGPPTRTDPPAAPQPAPEAAAWSRRIVPDPVLLFRYSALTFNGHRIHYDRDYATGTEGYPGLVVHGPLIATLLLELLWRERPGAALTHFEFRAVRPLFDLHPFELRGQPSADARSVRLWAVDPQGALAMDARATLR